MRSRVRAIALAALIQAGQAFLPASCASADERPIGSESVGQEPPVAPTASSLIGGPVAGGAAEPRAAFPFEIQTAPRPASAAPRTSGLNFMMFQLPGQAQDQSVYSLPTPQTEEEGTNAGGINLDIKINYLTDYLYRGIDRAKALNTTSEAQSNANFQFDGTLSIDLQKFPHPFIGVFANVLDNDPVSNFQEVRPFFGAEWRIRPFILAGGNNLYQFPDRNELNTAEAWGKITLDDAAVFRNDEPLLSPYVYAAYDYDLYNGWYIEAGVKHDFVIEDTGLTLTVLGSVAYVINHQYFAGESGDDTGLHHYAVGVTAKYSLNTLLNIPRRYGQWSFNGFLYYSDGLDDDLRTDTDLWGGAGIQLTY